MHIIKRCANVIAFYVVGMSSDRKEDFDPSLSLSLSLSLSHTHTQTHTHRDTCTQRHTLTQSRDFSSLRLFRVLQYAPPSVWV